MLWFVNGQDQMTLMEIYTDKEARELFFEFIVVRLSVF